ncbi:MAG: transposase, partial [Adhaeribacter sp.]|nr:transposase [Adhaeribacter sp.]
IRNVLLGAANKRICCLSDTYEGSVHDKKIAEEANIHFAQTVEWWQLTGFPGFEPANATIVQPVKKSRGKELSQDKSRKIKERLLPAYWWNMLSTR